MFASSVAAQLDARLRYDNGIEAVIRYDFHPDRPFRRGLHVVGDGGSVLWLMETGKTTLQVQRGRTKRDLPFHGGGVKVPAQHVVRAFIAVLEGAAPAETLEDGCNALLASRLLTEAAAEHLGMTVDVDTLAGGLDR